MRIYLSSAHDYPGSKSIGFASSTITDLTVKGLAELGHEVLYDLRGHRLIDPLPEGVILVKDRNYEVDIMHLQDTPLLQPIETKGVPWVKTFHAPYGSMGMPVGFGKENIIFVSKSHANSYGNERFVYNGIDPSELIYSEDKEDYILFLVQGLERAILKGLGTAIILQQELGIKLRVAGSSKNTFYQEQFAAMCRNLGIDFLGEIRGEKKAKLIANAKALIAPTLCPEPFGLVIAEALVSGTPVICSNQGAFPEIVSSEVGFVCNNIKDYFEAIEKIDTISPKICRKKGIDNFHYLRMAKDYVKEYKKEIALNNTKKRLIIN